MSHSSFRFIEFIGQNGKLISLCMHKRTHEKKTTIDVRFRKQMIFLLQNILTFYCLNEEKRMSTSQKLAVTVKLFTVK